MPPLASPPGQRPSSGAPPSPLSLLDRKLVFVTGKGGVGKTTVAAALALLAAGRGKRTLVCEVEDNGPGMPDADVRAGAFGLHAVRRRLALEAPNASLRHESSPEGTISIVEFGAPREA